MSPIRRAAVLGHPIAHSLSPVLHRAAYAALGLDGWTYQAVDVDEAGLAGFLAGLDTSGADGSWAGLSLTMPLKRTVRSLLAAESELAAAVGAVNTVTFGPDGPVGDNTDVAGMVAALREAGVDRADRAAVLGGGATATSAVAALLQLGCDTPAVHVRRLSTTGELQAAGSRLGVHPVLAGLDQQGLAGLAGLDLVISTLPGGAADELAGQLVSAAGPDRLPLLLDVVYAPWPTPLATRWTAAGGRVVGGFPMLLHQAADQVRLMTGRPAPLTAMRAAGEAELARRRVAAGS
ncbi:MAG TPA: shikimate dehydrogenase [Kineosporiaceae bacterium]|nr:shikimate dehydrogenase [Kineosporiaceae bacterium]